MRYQVLILIFMVLIISLNAMNCEYVTRFGESNTSMRLNNMIIENGKLYLCKEFGIDIFEIEGDGELTLLNTIHVDDVNNFAIDNNNLYFSCWPFGSDTWDTIIYKYDVSDPEQPVETGQMELDYPPYTMYIWHDMLTIVDFILTRQLLYYDPETLEYIDNEEGTFLKPFYGEYWCTSNPDSLTIYDLSNPFDALEATSIDLGSVYNGYNHVCRRITDDLYVVYSQLEMSLWDTSDFSNWQLLNQFLFPVYEFLFYDLNIVIWDDKILLPLVEEMLVVDISDPESPQVQQVLYSALSNPTNCLKYGEKIYLVDNYMGIQVFDIIDNVIEAG
ncbi:MAG: selenium-binding family protein [Candidatus Cloacimonetes bacterium]|nr:selenium-binding family protein [Candidatus Cloacimonadota bacterium]